jgi:hypothetical protein
VVNALADFKFPAVCDSPPVEYLLDSKPLPVICIVDPMSTLYPYLAKEASPWVIDMELLKLAAPLVLKPDPYRVWDSINWVSSLLYEWVKLLTMRSSSADSISLFRTGALLPYWVYKRLMRLLSGCTSSLPWMTLPDSLAFTLFSKHFMFLRAYYNFLVLDEVLNPL